MQLNGSPTERTTAATDILLSLTAAAGVVYLHGSQPSFSWRLQLWSWPLGLIAAAAALGALYHGLILPGPIRRHLWQALTLALGIALALFGVGLVYDLLGPQAARRGLLPALVAGAALFLVSRRYGGLFRVFILCEGLILAAALAGYTGLAALDALEGAGWVAAGLLLSALAAGVQTRKRLRFTWVWEFDHNGAFHLLQAAGLVLLSKGIAAGG